MEGERCEGCPSPDASWRPAFNAHLCESCLWCRTDAELSATERANRAAALTARKGGSDE